MLTLMPFFVFFIVGTMAGALYAYRLIMASRQPGQRSATLNQWWEKPLPAWKYEPHASAAILIHTLSVLVLGFLALSAASNPGIVNNPLYANDTIMMALVWFVEYGSILIVGYLLGSLLIGFPLIVFRKTPVAVAITEKGMAFGRNLLPWRWFSHFAIDRDAGILRLFSAFSPDLPSMTLKLPEPVPLVELDGTLQGFLPVHPPESSRAWYQTKYLLLPAMLLACLAIVAAGWLASRLSRELSLFAITLLTTLLVFLGGRILNMVAFGVPTTGSQHSQS
jgi:hypothetical protein